MLSVLIVGAGPTGLTLACDLARRGVDCRIIERDDHHNTASRAKTIQPRSLEVADDLGVVDRILELGEAHLPTRQYDHDKVLSEGLELAIGAEPSPEVPYPAPVWIAQPHIARVLRERLADFGVHVELGITATELDQDEDGVTVTLRTPADEERIRASYVAGCDGGHSTIRKQAGITLDGTTYEENRWHFGDVHIDGLERGRQHLWMSKEHGILSLFPLPSNDIWQFQASIPTEVDEPEEPSLALFRRIFAERAGVPGVRIHTPGWLSLYRVNVRLADRYRSGRVFLAGDAAHMHSPAGGQGMNTGIQDAYNLGWKLGAVLHGADPALLDTYEAERRAVAQAVLDDSTARMHTGNDGKLVLKDLTDDFTSGLTISYCPNPNPNPIPGAIGPGDRVPDGFVDHPETGERVRVFDLLRGPQWTQLTPELLVRPDGYVASEEITAAAHVQGTPALRPVWTEQAAPAAPTS